MRITRLVVTLGVGALLAACADTYAPDPEPVSPEAHLFGWDNRDDGLLGSTLGKLFVHQLEWEAVSGTREFTYRVPELDDDWTTLSGGGDVSLWAVKGDDRTLEVRYRDAAGQWKPYFTFSVDERSLARRPDGGWIAWGDSVEITVSISDETLYLGMEPTGLQFSNWYPAKLRWYYTGADPDFNGNGWVDPLDFLIEKTLLGVRVQEALGDPWVLLDAVQSLLYRRFDTNLKHFSGYAIAW
jgi:hypothetical protein